MENKIILIAAVSEDGFITDQYGNGNFSSKEDKKQLRAFLHSNECDCFVCGHKTAKEFKDKLLYKPLFILSTKPQENIDNCIFIKNLSELYFQMNKRKLFCCALLGGAKTYHYFLENNAVNEMRITQEKIEFSCGVKLETNAYIANFKKVNEQHLSPNTKLFIFQKYKRRTTRV